MKVGKTARVALDVALSLMIVFEMFIQFTGEFLHEVVGFAFFASVAAHVALSAAWVRKTARNAHEGKLTFRRTALAIVGCLLAVATVVLGVSSVAISGILASAGFVWPIGAYSLWVTVHTISAYALCALVVVHLAMHWAFLASAMKVSYDPSRRRAISAGVNAVAALGVLALGVTAAGKMAPQVASAGQEALGTGDATDAGSVGNAGSAAGSSGAGDVSGANGAYSTGSTAGTFDGGSSEGSTSGKSGKMRGKGSGKTGKTRGQKGGASEGESGLGSVSGGSASDSAQGSVSGTVGGSASDSDNGSGAVSANPRSSSDDAAYTGAGNGSSASGICTLCRKQCPLSAPKCNKPYEAGLL